MRFFQQFPEVIVLTSAKNDGAMGSSTNPGDDGEFERNRQRFLNRPGISSDKLVMAGLVHEDRVEIVTEVPPEQRIPDTDGLVTETPGLCLAITTADCFPVFFCDPKRRTIGIAHAGREGALKRIIRATVERMEELGAIRSDIAVAVGPGIHRCCYVVGDDDRGTRRFEAEGYGHCVSVDGDGRRHGDIRRVLWEQLRMDLCLRRDQVSFSTACTACPREWNRNQFFSRRRDQLGKGYNMLSVIMLRQR